MELCAKFCKLIREAVGTKADLLFGTHGQFTASGAVRLGYDGSGTPATPTVVAP